VYYWDKSTAALAAQADTTDAMSHSGRPGKVAFAAPMIASLASVVADVVPFVTWICSTHIVHLSLIERLLHALRLLLAKPLHPR
jgi:hypothetical protein